MILNKNHALVTAKYGNIKEDQKRLTFKELKKVMNQREKHQNFLIFIAVE